MTILIADDNREYCATIGDIISSEGWNYAAVYAPAEVLEYLRLHNGNVALVLLDVDFNHPQITGLEVLAESKRLYPHIPVVMISGTGSINAAVQATRIGAENFIPKSDISREKLKEVLYTAMERLNTRIAGEETLQFMHTHGLIGRSKRMMEVAEKIMKYGKTELSVLITGETGTGKKIVAKALHAASRRAKANFVTVDIPNIPPSLFQSELFGHTKGAFSGATDDKIGLFQQAHQGTLFLDEIGDLPLELQPSLLLPIEDKKVKRLGSVREEDVNVRIISATDRNLPESIREKRFREQLYHRLRECEISLPPLRERREDIPLIVEFYVQQHNQRMGEQKYIAPAAMEYMQELSWDGNVRQLTNLLKRVLQTVSGDRVEIADIVESDPSLIQKYIAPYPESLPAFAGQPITPAAVPPAYPQPFTSHTAVPSYSFPISSGNLKADEDELKKQRVIATLTATNGNVSKAAAQIGISRETLHQWMRKFHIESRDFKRK
ncbi:MAG: sigma-54 dependent transcriptional regulator [Bacteroidota bacterium]|nr:sigma-54 dependent transcriptional regulator [Candidatus Kapabacteria bacterium]MDW8220532.1 sigma-54 dependent transcriptional regulator [Bacteroidota bacterium]